MPAGDMAGVPTADKVTVPVPHFSVPPVVEAKPPEFVQLAALMAHSMPLSAA